MADTFLWPNANPRRGLAYAEDAEQFVKDFNIGTYLMMDTQFDRWGWQRNLFPRPSPEARANHSCDEWIAHLSRRHKVLKAINRAATHPRMSTPFVIAKSNREPGEYVVRAPEDEAMRGRLARKINSLTVTYRKQLQHLLQGPDYGSLPVEVRFLCEETFRGIGAFGKRVSLDANLLIENLEELRARLENLDYSDQLLLTDENGGDEPE